MNNESREEPFGLDRFVKAQESVYSDAFGEIRSGRKRTHWMWFVFPQIDGLGQSSTSRFYAVKSLEEARAYLAHPVLGPRIIDCAEAVLSIEGKTPAEVFGYPDDLKLRSSMTLFARVSEESSVFARVIERCFGGRVDERTVELLEGRGER